MASRFPGMDPYLEQQGVWVDFHQSMVPVLRRQLTEQVRPNYVVKIEEQLFIHEQFDEERTLLGRGDVAVGGDLTAEQASAVTIEAPVTARLPENVDVEPHGYLEIRDRAGQRLITVIKLLSPSNKNRGPDRDQYLVKRRRLLDSDAHLVEIDLLRGGPRMPLNEMPNCDYAVTVSRRDDRPDVGVWPIRLEERLPTVPVPLADGDDDAQLDLQAALVNAFEAAGYEDYIYDTVPTPPLTQEQAAWAESLA